MGKRLVFWIIINEVKEGGYYFLYFIYIDKRIVLCLSNLTYGVPISEDDTVGTVSDRFMQIVANFQEQEHKKIEFKNLI